nr:retrotransposon-related protein [Tanacetum cinerariifolium]
SQVELQATRGMIQATRLGGGGGDLALQLPRSMKLDVPMFFGPDPERWIFSITEYFTLLNTSVDQRLRMVGFSLEGDAAEWFRWMSRNNLITTWDEFLESVQHRFGPCKYEDPQGALSKLLQTGTRELLVSKPTSLGDVFSLARVTEARLNKQGVVATTNKSTTSSPQTIGKTTSRFTVPRLDSSKPALLPTPPTTRVNSGATLFLIEWISPAERQKRLSKGLCFNCDSKWVRGHKCPGKFLLLMVEEDDAEEQPTDVEQEDAIKSGDISILTSLSGQRYTLRGEDSLRMKRVSLHYMRALLETEEIYGVYELYNLEHAMRKGASADEADTIIDPAIEQLLTRFKTLFQVPTTLPPHRSIDHRIHLYPNTKPINVHTYRYPHYQIGEMEKLVNGIVNQGIIRVSHSPFSVLLVKKKDGSYHFCVDYRALNEVTFKDKFPIPTAYEMFDDLGGAMVFTKLDLRAGYHHMIVMLRSFEKPRPPHSIISLSSLHKKGINNFVMAVGAVAGDTAAQVDLKLKRWSENPTTQTKVVLKVEINDCPYAFFTDARMLVRPAHLDCGGSHGVRVPSTFAKSERMVESENWSPQQPPQAHAGHGLTQASIAAIYCSVIADFRLNNGHLLTYYAKGRLLGTYDLRVATLRALVHAGDKISADAMSWYMISVDAKSWVVIVLHIFTVILHNCPLFEILAHRLGFLQTYEFTNIIVDVFEYHSQVVDARKNIETVQGDVYHAAQQMLIHKGKVLKDTTTVEEHKVAKSSFTVVMLSKYVII